MKNNYPLNTYIEPFAGGAGAALALLLNNHVKQIILNDADEFIYKFWYVTLNHTDELIKKIKSKPINIRQWEKQWNILNDEGNRKNMNDVDIAYATLYLNRCNRSGIISSGGPIGGYKQEGQWKIDCRFNKDKIIKRIKRISEYENQIEIFNCDAVDLLKKLSRHRNIDKALIYMDPPYFEKGSMLYRKYFEKEDHEKLQKFLKDEFHFKWVLSYDDSPFINDLYKGRKMNGFSTNHFAHKAKIGRELIILSDNCVMPEKKKNGRSRHFIWN